MHESVFRLDPRSDGLYSITRASFDTTRPNGLVLSPDETTLYLAESLQACRRAPRASCLLVAVDGSLGPARMLHDRDQEDFELLQNGRFPR